MSIFRDLQKFTIRRDSKNPSVIQFPRPNLDHLIMSHTDGETNRQKENNQTWELIEVMFYGERRQRKIISEIMCWVRIIRSCTKKGSKANDILNQQSINTDNTIPNSVGWAKSSTSLSLPRQKFHLQLGLSFINSRLVIPKPLCCEWRRLRERNW